MSQDRGPRGGPEGRMGTPESLTGAGRWSPTSAKGMPRRVEKPWGHELIWAESEDYVGKILFIRAGESLSLQFHEEKEETLYLESGKLIFELGPGVNDLVDIQMQVGERVHITPGLLHRMEAITDTTLIEVSTNHLDDVVRVRDRYGRASDAGSGTR